MGAFPLGLGATTSEPYQKKEMKIPLQGLSAHSNRVNAGFVLTGSRCLNWEIVWVNLARNRHRLRCEMWLGGIRVGPGQGAAASADLLGSAGLHLPQKQSTPGKPMSDPDSFLATEVWINPSSESSEQHDLQWHQWGSRRETGLLLQAELRLCPGSCKAGMELSSLSRASGDGTSSSWWWSGGTCHALRGYRAVSAPSAHIGIGMPGWAQEQPRFRVSVLGKKGGYGLLKGRVAGTSQITENQ